MSGGISSRSKASSRGLEPRSGSHVSSMVSSTSLRSAEYGSNYDFSSDDNSTELPSTGIRNTNNNRRNTVILVAGVIFILMCSVGLGVGIFFYIRIYNNSNDESTGDNVPDGTSNDANTLSPSQMPSLTPEDNPTPSAPTSNIAVPSAPVSTPVLPSSISPTSKEPISLIEPSIAPSIKASRFPSLTPFFPGTNKPSRSMEPSILPSNIPTQSPSTQASSNSPSTTLFSQINEVIASLYPDIESPLLNSSSPQSKALTWMNYDDQYTSTSPEDSIQRFSVVVMYFSFHANTWTLNNNWMTYANVCTWYGILCYSYPTNLIVNQILLNNNSVKGFIPREIVLLNEIDYIDLGNNQIGGTIPSLIGSLQKLNDLRLYSNSIESTIPSDIGRLFSLRTLYLDNNKISGAIPEEFWNAYSIKDVKLNNNLIQGTLSDKLYTLSNLERFWISDNQMTGKFPSNERLMINLKYLYINNNKFTGTLPMYMPDAMFELRDLRMSNNSFSGCIPKTAFKMKYLETLYLDSNKFQCEIFPEIYNGPSLVDLQMQHNNLFGKLPQVLDHVSKLQYLDISNNALSDLPNDFVPLRYINYLSLHNNRIKGTIPPKLGLLSDLEMLKLDHNYFSGMIPLELDSFTKLKLLFLEENNLIGTMPTTMCDIQRANSAVITADCYGEYPLVNCNCCSNCESFAS